MSNQDQYNLSERVEAQATLVAALQEEALKHVGDQPQTHGYLLNLAHAVDKLATLHGLTFAEHDRGMT